MIAAASWQVIETTPAAPRRTRKGRPFRRQTAFVVALGSRHVKTYQTKCAARAVVDALLDDVTEGWHGAEAEAIRKSLAAAGGAS